MVLVTILLISFLLYWHFLLAFTGLLTIQSIFSFEFPLHLSSFLLGSTLVWCGTIDGEIKVFDAKVCDSMGVCTIH